MKVVTATMFWGEAERDLLAVKLMEEQASGLIDQHIVSEATTTFSGLPRRPLLDAHIDGYLPRPAWSATVRHIVVETGHIPGTSKPAARRREMAQRDVIGYRDLADDDVVIATDLDEIIQAADFGPLVEAAREHGLARPILRNYLYRIDLQRAGVWHHAFAATGAYLRRHDITLTGARRIYFRRHLGAFVRGRGQHFGFLGSYSDQRAKLAAYCARENDCPKIWDRCRDLRDISSGEPLCVVPVDGTYPAAIREDAEYWQRYRV